MSSSSLSTFSLSSVNPLLSPYILLSLLFPSQVTIATSPLSLAHKKKTSSLWRESNPQPQLEALGSHGPLPLHPNPSRILSTKIPGITQTRFLSRPPVLFPLLLQNQAQKLPFPNHVNPIVTAHLLQPIQNPIRQTGSQVKWSLENRDLYGSEREELRVQFG